MFFCLAEVRVSWLRIALYGNIVVSFAAAGLLDLRAGEWKLGTVGMVFALANGLIFFWR